MRSRVLTVITHKSSMVDSQMDISQAAPDSMPRRACSRRDKSYLARNWSQLCGVRVMSRRKRVTFGAEVSTLRIPELIFDRADQNSPNLCGLYLTGIRLQNFATTLARYSNHSRSSRRSCRPIFLRKQES